MNKTKFFKRVLGPLLCFVLIMTCIPFSMSATEADISELLGAVADPGTADSYENMMGTDADGNRYAGRVWVDKSIYKDGDVATLNSRNEVGSSFEVELEDDEAFQVIFSALGSSMSTKKTTVTVDAFNPITSSTSTVGGIGADNTPLVYVDFIGQYMEIKRIQSISLFGASYGVIKNVDGTYTVDMGTGINPTTNEEWKTDEDISLSIIPQDDGTQKFEIKINQEILPIIMEQVVTETVGGKTTSTITEILQDPLRVYYTVGVDTDILLPNGDINISKIKDYEYIDAENGTVSFYSNRFGVMNPADDSQTIVKGDAHVGFLPSRQNRYYYNQSHQGIFTKIIDKTTGKDVDIPENNQYGIVWDESKYDLQWMTYDEYLGMDDDTRVYTYVTFYRPTPNTTDAANVAEEVTYLRYSDWKYLKGSVAFYDATAKVYLNDGKAVEKDLVGSVVASYMQNNPNAQIYAVLGVESHRSSRLHNMTVNKSENATNTALERYTPEYTYETAKIHNGNEVVVWLGNNGKLTLKLNTGMALTKNVIESIGNSFDSYALTVTVPSGVEANPKVADKKGDIVLFTYKNNVLTVNVKAGETVYISGIPEGTRCEIGEVIKGDYYIESKTDCVTIPTVSEVLNGASQFAAAQVTNAPNKYGNLYITKEVISNYNLPENVLDTPFNISVDMGKELANKEFTIKDSNHTDTYELTTDENGVLVFQIKARETIEILNIPQGTIVSITEINIDDHFAVSYRTRNHSGEDADSDNNVVIPNGGNATAVVLNRYFPNPLSVDLDVIGTNNFVAEGNTTGGKFTYKVQKWNGDSWEDIIGKTAETPYAENESGTKSFTIENVLEGIVFENVGSYSYQVLEVKGNVANVTYDRTLYTFVVNVTDNGGQLVATVIDLNNNPITDGTYEVVFNNTYHTAPISLDVKKIVENKSGDTTISSAGFEFKAVRTDENWNALTGEDASSFSIYSDAVGEARFTSVCTKVGTYYFLLSEVNKNDVGWLYSNAKYRITVTVTADDTTGDLTATISVEKVNSQNEKEVCSVDVNDATRGSVTFVNTYAPDNATINLDGVVRKELKGKELVANQFKFFVYKNNDRTAPVLEGTNALDGEVDFDNVLTFAQAGKYEYDIVEYIPEGAVYNSASDKYVLNGMSYDATIYDLVVEVTNDVTTGKLKATYYFEDSVSKVITFRNSYQAEYTEYTISGTKVLHGRAAKRGEFYFELYEGDILKETVSNKADGTFTFNEIMYLTEGEYTYTIKEKKGNIAGVQYDGVSNPITVVVTVEDINGVLNATVNTDNADIRFENTYVAKSAEITFNGTKEILGGEDLGNLEFAFNLYKTDNTFDIESDSAELLSTVESVNGVFSFKRILNETNTYYFVITESTPKDTYSEVVYDRTEHPFIVKVSDVGNGQLVAEITNVITGVVTEKSVSASTTVSFVNVAVDEVIKKEVYLGESTTNIDGKEVSVGDVLTYSITYKNYTDENVIVSVVDAIPAGTTYVDGSVTMDGTYAEGNISWLLSVSKDESITVTFSVKVVSAEGDIVNTAVIRDGVNIYNTNEVKNLVKKAETPVKPNPPAKDETPTQPDNETPAKPVDKNTPNTGEHATLLIWFALLFVTCGGFISVGIYDKRKKGETK